MSITSETFYRAECDVESCAESSSTPNFSCVSLSSWFYDGERVLCPQHHPEARPCSTCGGQGSVKVPGRQPKFEGEWLPAHHWEECPECHLIGFHPAQPIRTQEEK